MKTSISITRGLGALRLALAISACEGSLSLDAAGELAMTMQQAPSSLLGMPASQSESQNRTVSPDTVSSFFVTVTSVQVLHASSDSVNGGSWATVQLGAPVRVDLMALSSSDDSARVIAQGRIEAGSYTRVRLILANPTIRFKGDVGFGLGGILRGGVNYGVELAGASNGVEINATVNVESSAEGGSTSTVHLVFDQNATLGSVSVAGNGQVILTAAIGER